MPPNAPVTVPATSATGSSNPLLILMAAPAAPAAPIEIPPAFVGPPTDTTPLPHPATAPTSPPGAGDPPPMIKPSVLLRLPGTAVTTPAWDAVAATLNKAATDKAMPVNFMFIFVFMNYPISVGQPRNSSSDHAWTCRPKAT